MKILNCIPILLCALLFISACKSDTIKDKSVAEDKTAHLGEINFEVTGTQEALPPFEKGMLLLHSFEYEDARAAFIEAQELDPAFAMAYWGEAMTFNHSLWQRQEKEKAIAALEKLAATPEARLSKVKTDLEKDFFSAIEILFGDGTKYDRDIAYNKFMEELSKKYPQQHEVSAFYAISLLGASRNGRDAELYEKSARIAQGIIKENPQHPGALHYLIHSYDDPMHAHLAKSAADSYSKTAPDAAHALHMPSHIYVALGKWNDVINSNIASWNASVKRIERKELDDSPSYHAFSWLQYGLLQRGETEQATKLLSEMIKYEEKHDDKSSKSYLIAMLGAQMVETNDWNNEFINIELEVDDLNIAKRTGWAFIKGMQAYHEKDAKKLGQWITSINEDRKKAAIELGSGEFAMCSSGGFANKPPNQLDIDMTQVMEMQLQARLATLNGKFDEADKIFQEALVLDQTLSYSYGPPVMLKPIHEAYADWLLEQNQPKRALEIYDKALQRQPRRLLSLRGKKRAAELINHNSALAEVSQELAVSMEKRERGLVLSI